MLTIGQLAAYAGVTVRAVRHYHARGLLPEPDRDHSGYRRYDAAAVVALIRIRTLAAAGVPLARVHELLAASDEEFAAAVREIDVRLAAEIAERQRHRRQIQRLAAGDSLALPPPVVAYVHRMRELGFPERIIEIERDSWILIAARVPDLVEAMMGIKRQQIEDPLLRQLYRDVGDLADYGPDDPRLPALADRVVAFVEAASDRAGATGSTHEDIGPDLIALLDAAFLESFPCAPGLLGLLEQRGWTGFTDIRRRRPPAGQTTNGPATGSPPPSTQARTAARTVSPAVCSGV